MADLFHFSPHLFQGRIFMPIVGPTSLGRKHVRGQKRRSQRALPAHLARARYVEGGSPLRHTGRDGSGPRSPAGDSSASALRVLEVATDDAAFLRAAECLGFENALSAKPEDDAGGEAGGKSAESAA